MDPIIIPLHKPQCVAEYLYQTMSWEQAKRLTTSYRLERPDDLARMRAGQPKAWEAGDPDEWERPMECGLYSGGMTDVAAEVLEEFERRRREGHPITTCPSTARVWDRAKVEAVMAELGMVWDNTGKKHYFPAGLEWGRHPQTAADIATHEKLLNERVKYACVNPLDR